MADENKEVETTLNQVQAPSHIIGLENVQQSSGNTQVPRLWSSINPDAESIEQQIPDTSKQDSQQSREVIPLDGPTLGAKHDSVAWTASEFIAHDKSLAWYLKLSLWGLLFAAVLYLLTKSLLTGATVIVSAAVLGLYGSRKPRQLQYKVNQRGVSVGVREFTYDDFRTFSIMPEGVFSSITFMPLKRFAPPVSLYYAPEDEEKIVAIISEHLPLEDRQPDAVDSLMRRIRF